VPDGQLIGAGCFIDLKIINSNFIGAINNGG
jgi:hypothetical protein